MNAAISGIDMRVIIAKTARRRQNYTQQDGKRKWYFDRSQKQSGLQRMHGMFESLSTAMH